MLQVIKLSGKEQLLVISNKALLNKFHTCCSKQQSVIQQLLSRKGRLIVMCSKGDASAVCSNGSSRVIEVPEVADCLQPVINIIPLQVCLSLFCF
jgi:glucosamine--fructose-6-phosphate aminotransferase (isomerizing)